MGFLEKWIFWPQGTSVARTDGNFLHFVQVNELYCPIYGLVVWTLRLFWKVFDWDIFDEITSNIGVITLVAFLFCCGRRRPQKRIWWVIIQSKEILITNTIPQSQVTVCPRPEDQPENQLITRNPKFHIWPGLERSV